MIKFGPSGNSESFYAAGYAHTEQAAKFVKDLAMPLLTEEKTNQKGE